MIPEHVYEFSSDLSAFQHEAQIVLSRGGVPSFWPLGDTLGRWTFELSEQLAEPPSLAALAVFADRDD